MTLTMLDCIVAFGHDRASLDAIARPHAALAFGGDRCPMRCTPRWHPGFANRPKLRRRHACQRCREQGQCEM